MLLYAKLRKRCICHVLGAHPVQKRLWSPVTCRYDIRPLCLWCVFYLRISFVAQSLHSRHVDTMFESCSWVLIPLKPNERTLSVDCLKPRRFPSYFAPIWLIWSESVRRTLTTAAVCVRLWLAHVSMGATPSSAALHVQRTQTSGKINPLIAWWIWFYSIMRAATLLFIACNTLLFVVWGRFVSQVNFLKGLAASGDHVLDPALSNSLLQVKMCGLQSTRSFYCRPFSTRSCCFSVRSISLSSLFVELFCFANNSASLYSFLLFCGIHLSNARFELK